MISYQTQHYYYIILGDNLVDESCSDWTEIILMQDYAVTNFQKADIS